MKSLTRGYLKAGFDSVKTMKWRNFWTMLGVIIGVASVITVVGIGDGIKKQISDQLHKSGNNIITIRPAPLNSTNNNSLSAIAGFDVSGTLSQHDADVVNVTPGVQAEAPLSAITARLKGDQGKYASGLVIGTNPNFPSMMNQTVANGIFLTNADMNNDSVVLGSQAAINLFKEDVPLGQTLFINNQPFIVKGIMNAFPSTPLSQDANYNNSVFVPYNVVARLTNNTASTFEILAQPSNPKHIKQVAQSIKQALTKAHGGQVDFTVLTANQSIAQNNTVLGLLTDLTTGIAAISLIVGGVGIMNVMLVSVTERMHEIGIRKAIGATNRQILSQFIIESILLSVSGGVIGIIVAFMIEFIMRLYTNIHPLISWEAVIVATTISILIGVIFGSVPAFKAANKDPITSLRSE